MNRQILNLATPNIISNITIPLLGMVDLAIMGHLDSEKYLGAISLGGMIFNFIYISFNFLRMGTGGFTAQAFGKGDKDELLHLLIRSLFIGLLCGLFLILVQVPIERIGFYLIEGSQEVEELAAEYFYIRIYAAPATIGLFALTGWFIGMQDAKTPMFIAILINVVNVLLNLLFVYEFNMTSNGVALGTLISQYVGFFTACFIILRKHKALFSRFSLKAFLDKAALKRFFVVNLDIFIRTVVLISVFSFFTAESAKISDNILAIDTLLLQYLMMFSFIMDGFAHAAEALSGKYLGMNNKGLLKKTVKYVFLWGTALSAIFSLVYFTLGEFVLIIFTDNVDIIHGAKPFLIWVAIVPLLSFASYLWDGIYIGVTASRAMRDTMLFSALLVFTPLYYSLNQARRVCFNNIY
jgi:MATE family multidrug resistance protein